tara:strand:+ start:272 stop:496 length:225 start_codon:yes stop_codon:yes gene_type:complete
MTNFTKEEIDIIREMMFVGSVTAGIDIYLEGVEGKKEVEANKILFKLGFGGINKDGSDDDIDKDGNYILEEMDF